MIYLREKSQNWFKTSFVPLEGFLGYGLREDWILREAHARLLFGSYKTLPIIWIGKPTPAIQCYLRVEIWQVGAKKHCRGGWGRRVKDDRKQNTLSRLGGGGGGGGGTQTQWNIRKKKYIWKTFFCRKNWKVVLSLTLLCLYLPHYGKKPQKEMAGDSHSHCVSWQGLKVMPILTTAKKRGLLYLFFSISDTHCQLFQWNDQRS
jgi:hypothetical protein